MIKLIKFYLRRLGKCNLKNFYQNYKFKIKDPILNRMLDNFINSKSYNYTSNIWRWVNIKNLKHLNEDGVKNYSKNIAENYFVMDDFNSELIKKAFKNAKDKKINQELGMFETIGNSGGAGDNIEKLLKTNVLTFLLFLNLKKNLISKAKLLRDNTYINFGKFSYISVNKTKFTQDKINSLFEYDILNKNKVMQKTGSILEIGAGSGRTTEAILTLSKNIKRYLIVDIPPAMYICYSRLKIAFPKKKIALGIDINNAKKLEMLIENNDIVFIFPHQLSDISSKFDLTLAIDCLHEFDESTRKFYSNFFYQHSKYLYFTVWKLAKLTYGLNPHKKIDGNNLKNYYIKNTSKILEKDTLIYPSNFINYLIKL